MSQIIASLAARVASTADFVARTAAPVDAHGATPSAFTSLSSSRALFTEDGPGGAIYRLPPLLKRSAQDVQNAATMGPAFRLEDLPAYIDAAKNLNGVGLDDRLMLLEKLLVLMSRSPKDSEFAKRLQVFVIDVLFKDLPHPPSAYIPLPSGYKPSSALASWGGSATNGDAKVTENGSNGAAPSANGANAVNGPNGSLPTSSAYKPPPSAHPSTYDAAAVPYAARSADGSGYNPLYPDMGKAGSPYARTVPPIMPISRQSLPDAGLVFDELLMRRPNAKGDTKLPKTDEDGFATHPGGISSLFFTFADLVIHSCFNTNHTVNSINNTSSYLDLSPLYGNSKADLDKVRRKDGTGRLWDDVFADSRLLFMPPNVCALLILFCRNHNYIATKLLAIDEWGTYSDPEKITDETERLKQDDEIFERTRLVNCGFFMQVILGDYVGAILGLVRDGSDWRLDPLAGSRELDHEVSPRGQGNVVSVEFNLLYRWHAALSKPDTEWTEELFESVFNTKDFKSITVDQFITTLAQVARKVPADVREWSFGNLKRDPKTNAFNSGDLANLLQSATEASASAFKARGIPEVLRVVEVMGIEQARRWGTCTMNEFRSFMGLRPYETFEQWNPDPSVAKAAEMLYGHIDNLELHVGMQAEEAKTPMPGAGLCPGYTISRAILSDAVALVRGDPFLTTEFTVYNLTSWGYQDCYPLENDGSYGGMLTRLLYRTLPDYYPPGSAYAHFPFMVPQTMKGYLSKLVDNPVSKYTFTRPPAPQPVKVIQDFNSVQDVLQRKDLFDDGYDKKLMKLTKGAKVDVQLVNTILDGFNKEGRYSGLFGHITEKLLKEKSVPHLGSSHLHVDIVKDVINLVPVYFISTELLGLPIKTAQTPHGAFRDVELHEQFANICNYVFLNTDPYLDWVLREKAAKAAEFILATIEGHLARLSGFSILAKVTDSVSQWYTGERSFSDLFLGKVLSSELGHNIKTIAASVFAAAISTAAVYSKAIVHVVDFFLHEDQEQARAKLAQMALTKGTQSDAQIYKYAREALRLNPPVPSITRTAKKQVKLEGAVLNVGQPVYCNIINANLDSTIFGNNSTEPNFDAAHYGILGMVDYGFTDSALFQATIPRVLRAIFKLKNLGRAAGESGSLTGIVEMVHGAPEVSYLDFKSRVTPFPAAMLVQYDP